MIDGVRMPAFVENYLMLKRAYGAENAIKMDIITAETRCERRHFQKLAERERLDGAMILSNGDGYFLPDENPIKGASEVRKFIGRNTKIIQALSKINRAYTSRLQVDGQGDPIFTEEEWSGNG